MEEVLSDSGGRLLSNTKDEVSVPKRMDFLFTLPLDWKVKTVGKLLVYEERSVLGSCNLWSLLAFLSTVFWLLCQYCFALICENLE